MRYMEVTTLNSVYVVSEDDSGERKIVESTNPDEYLMQRFFIGAKVERLEVGKTMLVSMAHTSTVVSINDKE